MSLETKIKFGVTMNRRMGSKKMTDIWFNEVDEALRESYPELDAKMKECRTLNETLDIKQKIKETAKDVKDAAAEVVATVTVPPPAGIAVAAAIVAEQAALLDVNISIGLQNTCKNELHQEVDKIIPSYLPDEES